jgi:hypothetical protein
MQRMLHRFRSELNVQAPAGEMNAAIEATVRNLQSQTARLSVERAAVGRGQLVADLRVENLTGHKLPTGYPSRRAWLHVTVRDGAGRVMFESGALEPSGAIAGNDHDREALRVEPHYTEIDEPDEVQIYESVMHDRAGMPTTGLLSATGYVKDNRLLPRGFEKATADAWIAVVGTAAQDGDFAGAGDGVRYVVPLAGAQGPFRLDAELRFQVIGFRWAANLGSYNSEETRRFVTYYDAMASSSSEVLASVTELVTDDEHSSGR